MSSATTPDPSGPPPPHPGPPPSGPEQGPRHAAPDAQAGTIPRAPISIPALITGVRSSISVRDAVSALLLALLVAATGLLTGFGWSEFGPHIEVVMMPGGPALAEYYGESSVASQFTFGAIGVGAGLVCGPAVYYGWRRRRGPVMLFGLMIGCLAAAWIAAKFGGWLGHDHYQSLLHDAAEGQRFAMPVKLDAYGLTFLEPLMAVLSYVVVASWSPNADLGTSGRHRLVDRGRDAELRERHRYRS